jgi:hypothetical protein
VEKERFDYARVLIATSKFEIINCQESILIDGVLVTVKIVEEWGFNIGDDACLYEDEEGSDVEQPHQENIQLEQDVDATADLLVNELVQDLVESEGNNKIIDEIAVPAGSNSDTTKQIHCPLQYTSVSNEDVPSAAAAPLSGPSLPVVADSNAVPLVVQINDCTDQNVGLFSKEGAGNQRMQRRAGSCPPRADRSLVSDPYGVWNG